MAANKNRARNLVVGVGVVGIMIVFVASFFADNPERRALEQREQRLDRELVKKRAIAKDPERYRVEFERLLQRTAEADRMLAPDLDALEATLPKGVQSTRHESNQVAICNRLPFRLRGRVSTFEGALEALAASELLFEVHRISIDHEGWFLDGAAFDFIEAQPMPPSPEDPPPWYGRVNDDLRSVIEGEEAELDELNEALGDLADFGSKRKALEERLIVIEHIRTNIPDVRSAFTALALGGAPLFEVTDATALGARVIRVIARGRGTRREVEDRLPKTWRLEEMKSRDGVHELELSRVSPP